jgi:hypothetical protein
MDLVSDTPEFSQTGNKVLALVLEVLELWFGETLGGGATCKLFIRAGNL